MVIDEDVPGADVARIFVENEQGAYHATRFLIEAGHRRIAHVGGPRDLFSATERFNGFARALREAGVAMDPALVRFGDYDRDSGLAAIRSLMSDSASPPSAMFAGSDYIALGILQGLHELGLRRRATCRSQASTTCLSPSFLHPPLTTVRQPIDELGSLGVSTLLAQFARRRARGVARLPTALVLRGSVAAGRAPASGPQTVRDDPFSGHGALPQESRLLKVEVETCASRKADWRLWLFWRGRSARPPSRVAAPKFSAVYVMSDNLGDKGFNDSAAAGFHRAEAGRGSGKTAASLAKRSAALAAEPRGHLGQRNLERHLRRPRHARQSGGGRAQASRSEIRLFRR